MESLQTEWNDLNYVQCGDRLIELLSAGCTERGLAKDLSVDDGTVRRYIEIARLTEPQRKAIEAGANPKAFLEEARALILVKQARARLERESKDGTPSDELQDNLVWFVLTDLPEVCCAGYLEVLFREVDDDLREKARRGTDMHHIKVRRSLDPAYPLGGAIKLARPEPEFDWTEMETAIHWLVKLVLLLESLKQIRDAAIEKLKSRCFAWTYPRRRSSG